MKLINARYLYLTRQKLPSCHSNVWYVARVYKKDRLYLTLVTLGLELCQLTLVCLITEVFVMYSE